MKNLTVIILCVLSLSIFVTKTSTAENALLIEKKHMEEKTLKVWGNCGMCKQTIEKAVKAVKGVNKGVWNVDEKVLELVFDPHTTSIDVISKAVADAGYDTALHTASVDAYNNLHKCCQYERK